MGILADTLSADVKALTWVIQHTLQAWEDYGRKGAYADVQFECNYHLLDKFSTAGETLLKMKFPSVSPMDRVATLVVVLNCSSLFKVSRKGKAVINITERRILFSNLTHAFVSFALCWFPSHNPPGVFVFNGIDDRDSRYRFYSFLEHLGPVEITAISGICSETLSEKELQALGVMTRDIISVVNFLVPGIRFQPASEGESIEIAFETRVQLEESSDNPEG